MDAIMERFKKAYYSYLKLPRKIRFLIVVSFFMLLFVFSINISHDKGENIFLQPEKSYNKSDSGGVLSDDSGESTEKLPKEVIIVIDPGHGGEDLGATKGELYEKKLNLDISKRLGDLLEDLGIKVVYTRDKDVDVGLDERVNIANDLDATLFISIHNNYMPNDAGYKGTETLYCLPVNVDENKMDGKKLATIVQKKLVSALKTVDNGIIYRPNLVVLRKTKMPAVIAEIAYMSNSSDREKLSNENFRQNAAKALSEAVIEALEDMGVEKNEKGKWIVVD